MAATISLKNKILISVIGLLCVGHVVARLAKPYINAWIYVCVFYAAWLIASLLLVLTKQDIRNLFGPVRRPYWGLIGLPFVVVAICGIFIPNLHLLQLDHWLIFHLIICLVNPFMEEMYWRGLASRFSNRSIYSYLFSTLAFAVSHVLILGINTRGVAGWIGFTGTFIVGSMFWLVFYKTKSLWLCVVIHFFIDFFGMAAYTLADKAKLLDLPF